jgi:hypothetical protein
MDRPIETLQFPLTMPARVALLETEFRLDRNARTFSGSDLEQLRLYAPEALVAPLTLALFLADQQQRGLLALPSLCNSIVVLTSTGDSPLADHHRDLLWKAFAVPVFEQLRGWDGAVIARECEVHDGLHIDESAAAFDFAGDELLLIQPAGSADPVLRARTGLTGEIVTEHCECGAETPRLRNLAPVKVKIAGAAAGK